MTYSRLTLLAIFSAGIPIVSQRAQAHPVAFDSIDHLIAVSNLIVVGAFHAQGVKETVSAVIQVERVVAGKPSAGGTVALSWKEPNRLGVPSVAGDWNWHGHGIFFMKRTASNYEIVPVLIGADSWDEVYIKTPGGIGGQAISSPGGAASRQSAFEGVLSELLRAVQAGEAIPYNLVEIYRQSHSPTLLKAFAGFRTDKNPTVAALGVQGALAGGDSSAISYVDAHAGVFLKTTHWGDILNEIRIFYVNTSPPSVRALGRIATSTTSNVGLRNSAAIALARMHTRGSLPYLFQLLNQQLDANGRRGRNIVVRQ